MHISDIKIVNYRNYYETNIQFSDGLNVIVGPNNIGKTNLLNIVNFLYKKPDINIDDINKYNLISNVQTYCGSSPKISIIYTIEHEFSYNQEDSALSRLKNIIIFNKKAQLKSLNDNQVQITAQLELRFELDATFEGEYIAEAKQVRNYDELIGLLNRFETHYAWNYYNYNTKELLSDKDINNIFDIDKIDANRIIDDLTIRSKGYVNDKIKSDKIDEPKIKQDITKILQDNLSGVINNINEDIEADQNSIGITNGKNIFVSDFLFDEDLSKFFKYELQDSKQGFHLPLDNNGLGYNNLIYIRNLIKQKKDNDYNVLLIEEPEAHLHPNMQYKLLKYLNSLEIQHDSERETSIKNQIMISTHSANITASVDLDKIILLSNHYNGDMLNIQATRLSDNFDVQIIKKDEILKSFISATFTEDYPQKLLNNSANHLKKFLDITRSDILFSDKIIFVEGIAEKLLIPAYDSDLIDKHAIVIELGGINFNYFLPLAFQTNKKILCVTDKDYNIFNEKDKILNEKKEYKKKKPKIDNIFLRLPNVQVVMQKHYGTTFEKELFIDNYSNKKKFSLLMKLAMQDKCNDLLYKNKSITYWKNNYTHLISNEKTRKFIKEKIEIYWSVYEQKTGADKRLIEKLFFAEIFYDYVRKQKGNFALGIVEYVEKGKLQIPDYIKEGVQWLKE